MGLEGFREIFQSQPLSLEAVEGETLYIFVKSYTIEVTRAYLMS